jgi:hypothetical protein
MQQQQARQHMSAAVQAAAKTEPGTAGAESSSRLPNTSDTGRAAPAANASAAAAATASGPGVFQLPQLSPGTPLAAVEPGLYGLLDAFSLPDELAEQLADALEDLGRGGDGEQQQQHADKLARFGADYAQVRCTMHCTPVCWVTTLSSHTE